MTNKLPETAPITLGWLWGQLDEKHRKEALSELQEWGSGYFEDVLRGAWEGMAFITPPPAQRLAYYKTKTLEEWEETRAKFPGRFAAQPYVGFEDQMADFERLLEREARGDLIAAQLQQGPEVAL